MSRDILFHSKSVYIRQEKLGYIQADRSRDIKDGQLERSEASESS